MTHRAIQPSLSCGAVRPRLTALLDGELSPDETASVEAHLASCTGCAAVHAEYIATLKAVSNFPIGTADMTEAVMAHVQVETHKPREVLIASGKSANPADPEQSARETLTDVLRRKDLITREGLTRALAATSGEPGMDIGEVLIRLGLVQDMDVYRAKAEASGFPFIDLTKHRAEPAAIVVVPGHLARKHNALPVKKDGQTLFVAMLDPRDIAAVDAIRMASRCIVRPMAVAPAALHAAIEAAYPEPEPPHTTGDAQAELINELRALRGEMEAMRGEMTELRRQIATIRATAKIPPRPVSPRLFPFAPPADLPTRDR